ncbi:hypothetical protein [Novosphingobium sp.]|uniref:hypothetical protein n=1 Tax=Novosphingobium sp. TaxID=1874826 RepID=UPI00261BE171|nr:hypothetical protein [Novosphingobium sp.]
MNITDIKPENGLSLRWAVLFVYALLLPQQLFFTALDFVVFPYRLILICMLPGIVSAYMSRKVRATFADLVVLTTIVWIFLSLSITIGLEKAIANGGASLLDVGVSYFAARCTITSTQRARVLLVRLGPAFLLAGMCVIFETLSGQYLLQPFMAKMLGVNLQSALFASVNDRLGLIRGTGPFSHPILGGLQLASILPLFLLAKIKFAPRMIGIMAAACSLGTVSSSAVIALFLAGGLVGYEYLGAQLNFLRWRTLVVGTALIATGLQLMTQGGIVGIVVNFMTLDKWTAYYRTLVWKYGVMNVAMHPLFGLGSQDWLRPAWMPGSIDNYWLYIAMSYGVPEALLRISLPVIVAFTAGWGMAALNRSDRRVLLSYSITIIILTLMAFTVSYWGITQAWYYFLIGTTLSLAQAGHRFPETAGTGAS